jgi:DNA-binding MarR family transcriptional regulator
MDEIRGEALNGEEAKITLGLLNAVEASSTITQRTVASELGIALGLANAYLKRCVRKGLVKVKQVPANRYTYYLTPKGFAEKSRLTAEYLTVSFNFFRGARGQCSEVFDLCLTRSWRRVALAGVSDLAEIAVLCAADHRIEIPAVYDPSSERTRFVGLDVVGRLDVIGPFDAMMITDFTNPQATFDALITHLPAERVLAPRLLAISRERPTLLG